MTTHGPATPFPRAAGSASAEELFDAYLDLALRGEAPDADEFLARHGRPDDVDLRARLAGLRRASQRQPAAEPAPDLPWARLGTYRLLSRLGRGGMGLVFEAEDESLGRRVALKVVRPELSDSPAARERFEREARAVARLRHPHIVTLHGAGRDGDVRFLVMERLEGQGLDERIEAAAAAGRPLGAADVLRWGSQLARALHYAHERGVVHRDVKPSNVHLTPDGRALLLDFGVARELGSEASTLGAAFVGSLPYAAPEQVAARGAVDGRTDVYALAATIYEALTGRRLFEGGTTEQLLAAVLHQDPRPPREHLPGLPRDLQTVLLKALEKDPVHRYATAGALADDLDAMLAFRPVSVSPPAAPARALKWLRRHPAASAALATGAIALAVLVGREWQASTREAREAREQAARLLAAARERVAGFDERQAQLAQVEAEVGRLQAAREAEWLTPEQDALLDDNEARIADLRLERASFVYETLERLSEAARLDPELAGLDAVRAQLYLALWTDAGRRRDARERDGWARLVREADPSGPAIAAVEAEGRLHFAVPPPDARVDLSRCVDLSTLGRPGEPRYVPVPWGDDAPPAPPGAFALRVSRDHGALRAGDHVIALAGFPLRDLLLLPDDGVRLLSVDGRRTVEAYDLDRCRDDRAGRPTTAFNRNDPWAPPAPPRGPVRCEVEHPDGRREARQAEALEPLLARVLDPLAAARRGGVAARVVREDQVLELELPPGTPAVPTATPALATARSRVAPGTLALPAGQYLLVVQAPGLQPLRVTCRIDPGQEVQLDLVPRPAGAGPAGCVLVDDEAYVRDAFSPDGVTAPAFWIMEREVLASEWAEFLDDPRTRAAIAAAPRLVLVPREAGRQRSDALWKQDAEGRWRWPAGASPDLPVTNVSLEDARAYAAWRSERSAAAGEPWRWTVPTWKQWYLAAAGRTGRPHVYGNRFRPKWSNTCFSRPLAGMRPPFSHPIDESVWGAFDLNGNAFEWCDSEYDAADGLWRVMGGAWGRSPSGYFTAHGGMGLAQDIATGETGVRLVATEAP